MSRSKVFVRAVFAGIALFAGASAAAAQETASAQLVSHHNVPPLIAAGQGTVQLTLNANSTISYQLTYSLLSTAATQAHIHLAQPGVNGGIMAFLCSDLGNGPAGTPACPGTVAGTVSGIITPAKIVGPVAQNIPAGQMIRALRAIRLGVTYATVHTTKYPGGEIRGQLLYSP